MTEPTEPMLRGDTFIEKLWHSADVPWCLAVLTLCWEAVPTWLRVTYTVIAAVTIVWVLVMAVLDLLVERERAKVRD